LAEAHQHTEKKHGHGGGSHGPPHGAHEEHHEGAPEWLISFADNVTLMMGFFVILFAMNMAAAKGGGAGAGEPGGTTLSPEMLDAIIAIREAFNNPVDPNSTNPIDLPLIRRLLERGQSQAEREGQIGREHDVRSIRPSNYYSIAGLVPFDEATSLLSDAGREAIRQIVHQMKGHNLVIEVRGHVSSAEAFRAPDRGMQLSYDRALAVATHLAGQGVPWNQMRIIACADGERLMAVAYDVTGHRANQRVELIVTDRIVKPTNSGEQP
jgi:flagellar motor protein MotB